ncbi:MAG: hypothetical protein ACPGLV_10875 [Bacteroidia bacterium]
MGASIVKYITILFFGITALYHFVGSIFHQTDMFNRISLQRHIAFVLIDGGFILLFFFAKPWFKWVLLAFMIQQIISHSIQFYRLFVAGKIDWISVIVMVFLPLLTFLHFKYTGDLN